MICIDLSWFKQNLSNKNAWQRSAERNLVVVLICIILMDLRFFPHLHKLPKTIINHPITSCYIDMFQIQKLQPSPPVPLFASQETTWEPFWMINRLPPFPATGYNFGSLPGRSSKGHIFTSHHISGLRRYLFKKKNAKKKPLRQTAWFFHSTPNKKLCKVKKMHQDQNIQLPWLLDLLLFLFE